MTEIWEAKILGRIFFASKRFILGGKKLANKYVLERKEQKLLAANIWVHKCFGEEKCGEQNGK